MSETDRLLGAASNGENVAGKHNNDAYEEEGSTIFGATVNVTNAILGAGCIGYGGAMAQSGGFISIFLIALFAILTLWSFDLLIELGIQHNSDTYEALAAKAGGTTGTVVVIVAKGVFSFGNMVAYIVIIKDNFSEAARGLLYGSDGDDNDVPSFLQHDELITAFVCVVAMLPLCLLRDVTPLEQFSSAKVFIYGAMLSIVVYLYMTLPPSTKGDASQLSFSEKWLEVKPGVIESMGTMVLAFVAAHTLHMFFRSLKPQHHNMTDWRKVSFRATFISFLIFLGLAIFAYMTYWDKTSSDLFQQYPTRPVVSLARLFLSIAMFFTYPMPLFTCRELIALPFVEGSSGGDVEDGDASKPIRKPGDLSLISHVLVTLALFVSSFGLAMGASSLGDVLNFIGCLCGTLISFVLPAVFSFQLQGPTLVATTLLVIGGLVGSIGTYFSFRNLVK